MKLAMTPPEVSSPNESGAVADEVAQPADDLLLDERAGRTGMPDVDALVRDLGQQLAHDRHRQRRGREVAELARVLGVHLHRRQALVELGEDGVRGRRGRRAPATVRGSRRPPRRRTRGERRRSRTGRPSRASPPARTGSRGRSPRSPRRVVRGRRGRSRHRDGRSDPGSGCQAKRSRKASGSWKATVVGSRRGHGSGHRPMVAGSAVAYRCGMTDDAATGLAGRAAARSRASRTSSSRAIRPWPTRPRSVRPMASARMTRPTRSSSSASRTRRGTPHA